MRFMSGDAAQGPSAARDGVRLAGTIVVNLAPLVGVLAFGWSALAVLLIYWLENVAIGVAQAVRIGVAGVRNRTPETVFLLPFFCVHYGMFTGVHGVFVVAMFGAEALNGARGVVTPGVLAAAAVIAVWQATLVIVDGRRSDWFAGLSPKTLMFEPYGRVIALHLTIIVGAMLVAMLGAPVWAVAVLTVMKLLIDLGLVMVRPRAEGPKPSSP